MRLIDADELELYLCLEDDRLRKYCFPCREIFEAIKAQPAMPSAEPKKGKWIPHSERCREYIGSILAYIRYDYWFCDTCGYRVEKGQPMYNFCPNCGADMRGEEDDSD